MRCMPMRVYIVDARAIASGLRFFFRGTRARKTQARTRQLSRSGGPGEGGCAARVVSARSASHTPARARVPYADAPTRCTWTKNTIRHSCWSAL
eukprot:871866-Prymnesium_polylepis.2